MERLGRQSITRLVGGALIALAEAACFPIPQEQLVREFVSAISDGNVAKATQMIEPDNRRTFWRDPYGKLDLLSLHERIRDCRITEIVWEHIPRTKGEPYLVTVRFGGSRCAVTDQTLGVAVSPRNSWIRGVTDIGMVKK